MAGVHYALADFVTGGPILDLPVMEGASWSAQLNRADSLTCKIDMKDADARRLDLRSATEPQKTVITARTDDDVVLAWGLLNPRSWDEDATELTLTANGVWDNWLGKCIIAPAAARTAQLITLDGDGYPVVNPALATDLTSLSLGTIGKRLVQQRLAWPGAPTAFDLSGLPDELGTQERHYALSDFKRVGAALTDLTNVDGGPDFAFDAQRASDGLHLAYTMRAGTIAQPRIGVHVGSWSLGGQSPITGLKVDDDAADLGNAAWLAAGKSGGAVLLSRMLNDALVADSGYPPIDVVDTSHNDVVLQPTLDAYATQLIADAARPYRSISFSVRADAAPKLGTYRPGDTMTIDVPEGHPWLSSSFDIRITSISGDEGALDVKIGCVIVS